MTLLSPDVVLSISGVLTEVTLCPRAEQTEDYRPLILGGVYASASCSGRCIEDVFPPLIISLAGKAGGGRGHRTVRGQEVGEVEASLI